MGSLSGAMVMIPLLRPGVSIDLRSPARNKYPN
jgi:hypothetical protein